jgi:hypothetical protein
MAVNFELISTYTVGAGGIGTITFSSIPATYKDLFVMVNTNGDSTYQYMNTITTSTYDYKDLVYFDNYPVRNYGGTLNRWQTFTVSGGAANYFGVSINYFANYAQSTYNKTIGTLIDCVNINSNADYYWQVHVTDGSQQSTAAINQLYWGSGGTIAQYSKISLYGITNS